MANFWNDSDNKEITTNGAFTSGGTVENIPDNTTCIAMIDEAGLAEYEGEEYISLRWLIDEPAAYKGRKIFQKFRVFDADNKKADNAKKMLMAIDANCGGKLAMSQESPNDTTMAKALLHKLMLIKVLVWEMDGRTGNWVASVAPRKGGNTAPTVTPTPAPVADEGLHDDIPW